MVDFRELAFDLRFAAPFDAGEASFEVFFLPGDVQHVGHTIRYNREIFGLWNAECSTVAPPDENKHSGCHWAAAAVPESFSHQWGPDGHVLLSVDLHALGLDGQDELLLGVAAAPGSIQRTADFTDRYPDELWVTATAVTGLVAVPLATK